MGLLRQIKACVETGAEYGAKGAALGATTGAAAGSVLPGVGNATGTGVGADLGLKIGGLYGCFRGGDFDGKRIGKLARKTWKASRGFLKRSFDWVAQLFGFGPRKKRQDPPPTSDEAVVLLIESFKHRPGAVFQMQGSDKVWRQVSPSFPLHPSALMDLYGPGGVLFDPQGLFDLLWHAWSRSLTQAPVWSPAGRMLICLIAVGLYLEKAPASASFERWPLLPPSPVSAAELALAGTPPPVPESAIMGGRAKLPPALGVWGVLTILTLRELEQPSVPVRRAA